MQIKLFPDDNLSPEADFDMCSGHIGPIRFAATPTSYPHLCQALATLIAEAAETFPGVDSED
ncbi:MAG: hypothetical protein JJV98_18780 [Desulfosarcina sp.]|nr:hypothetical protein [Desulfobacterales bacterium]